MRGEGEGCNEIYFEVILTTWAEPQVCKHGRPYMPHMREEMAKDRMSVWAVRSALSDDLADAGLWVSKEDLVESELLAASSGAIVWGRVILHAGMGRKEP